MSSQEQSIEWNRADRFITVSTPVKRKKTNAAQQVYKVT